MDTDFDIENLRWPKVKPVPAQHLTKKLPRHKTGQHFLKGPIPWNWITKAAQLPGKALHVSVCLWYLAGLKSNRTVPLSMVRLLELGVSRFAAYRGLKALAQVGLVRVDRHNGRLSKVELLDSAIQWLLKNSLSTNSQKLLRVRKLRKRFFLVA